MACIGAPVCLDIGDVALQQFDGAFAKVAAGILALPLRGPHLYGLARLACREELIG